MTIEGALGLQVLRRYVWWLIFFGWPAALWGAEPVQFSAQWCVAPNADSIESIRSTACRWQILTQPSGLLSQGEATLWVRLTVINKAPEPIERWLTLGNNRMQSVALYAPDATGAGHWQQGGMAYPRNRQSYAMREAAAFSLMVPAMSSTDVWLRIQSDTLVALSLRLWPVEDLRALRDRSDGLWMLWLGMGLALVMLALIFGFYARESTYALFAIAFLGQLVIEIHFSSVLQRTLWPPDWPMRSWVVLVGVAAFFWAGTVLVRKSLDLVSVSPGLSSVYVAMTVLGSMGLFWSTGVSFAAGAHLWLFCAALASVFATILSARAWQQGNELAGYLFIPLLLWSGSVLFRVLLAYGLWPESETSGLWFLLISLIEGAWLLSSLAIRSLRARREIEGLQASARSQLAMFARISHELRTPLDTILGNAQLLLRQRDRPPEISVLKIMLDSGRHLLGMIDELLDYARGLTGVLKAEPVATRLDVWWAGLERTGEMLAARSRNRFVSRFEDLSAVDQPPIFKIDAGRLRQVIDNLLVNAARYTRSGVITLGGSLEAMTRAPHQQYLHLYVEDTGCGIDPKDHERIFEPYQRLDRSTLAGGVGTGMGLPIARQLTALMGGELSLMSASGRGARFSVKIPIERSSETVKESVDASLTSVRGYAGSRQRLLIVDDDDHSIEILANLLKGVGFEIEMAHSGQEAEQILEKGQCFDAVITDQFMADGDGWRVLWVMHKRQPAVPVLLISAALPQEPIGWNHSVRFAATFLRPLKHTHLLQRLGDLLDLQWLFDVNPSSGLTGSLLRPGDDDIAELRQLVAFGEVTAIREWAQALRGREPRFASFADAVEEAVIEVDFGRLELLVVEA